MPPGAAFAEITRKQQCNALLFVRKHGKTAAQIFAKVNGKAVQIDLASCKNKLKTTERMSLDFCRKAQKGNSAYKIPLLPESIKNNSTHSGSHKKRHRNVKTFLCRLALPHTIFSVSKLRQKLSFRMPPYRICQLPPYSSRRESGTLRRRYIRLRKPFPR